jgi:hypothetical protein
LKRLGSFISFGVKSMEAVRIEPVVIGCIAETVAGLASKALGRVATAAGPAARPWRPTIRPVAKVK